MVSNEENNRLAHLPVWTNITSPSDWTFVFAFPANERGFKRACISCEYCGWYLDWNQYHSILIRPYLQFIHPLKSLGVTIIEHASLREFSFSVREGKCVVLFTHCNQETYEFEFRNGMVPFVRLVASVPSGFDGILDLSACSPPPEMAQMIKAKAPKSGVAYTKQELYPTSWLRYYAFFFAQLAKGNMSYKAAAELARQKFSSR